MGEKPLSPGVAIRLVPGWSPTATDFVSLHGGRTNRNFLVTAAGEHYVLRIGTDRAAEMGINRADEFSIVRAAAAAGIGPAVFWADPSLGILVTRFVRGRHWTPLDIRGENNMQRVARMLRAIHGLNVTAATFDPLEIGLKLQNKCPPDSLAGIDPTWAPRLTAIRKRSVPIESRCICHNDIGRGNFIDDGESLQVIDWECSGSGDPFYDLAIVAHNNRLSADQESELIRFYSGVSGPAQMFRLARMRLEHDFYHVCWYAFQASLPDAEPGVITDGRFHADRLNAELTAFNRD